MSDDFFRWVIAIGVFLAVAAFVVQTALVLVMSRVIQNQLMPMLESLTPLVAGVRRLVDENGPKLSQMATEAGEMTKSLRQQVDRLSEVVKDATDRARAQVARIDGAVDQTVEQVQHASETMRHAMLTPVKQVDGIVHGIRAALSVVAQGRKESVDHATQDEEMFI